MKIEIKNLTKKFRNNVVVNGLSITFESGKIYGIVGRNGSGKSVLLKMICGFYVPNEGEILIDGINYIKANGYPLDTRALIERPEFLSDLSGFDNLKILASIQNKITDKEILQALEDVNLIDEKDKKFSEYSLGMKQKLGIAQVLMENPKIMIFDEPFNGIEEQTVLKLRDLLKKLVKQDKIIIVATHIKEDVEILTDINYRFDEGILKK